eukprot:scaffold2368_cov248-Pinguiococcus_pyrenoidosus.AAC.9
MRRKFGLPNAFFSLASPKMLQVESSPNYLAISITSSALRYCQWKQIPHPHTVRSIGLKRTPISAEIKLHNVRARRCADFTKFSSQ